ncbi:MAG: choice-of-anchor J domain-containing protein, partial [Calditrichaeota bacterium]|nr:choice-of-anchor J domain-containing protein [Calditrichota bacterium]
TMIFFFFSVSNPNGNFTVNGSQTLQAGDNYFWVTYDINANSAPGQTVDASVVSMVVNSISRVPTVTSPSGSRSIQFVQGFETAVPPTGWTILNSSGTNWSRNTTVSFNGTSSAEAARTGTGDRYLITPQVLPTLSNHTLKFWARKHASAGSNEGSLHIRVSTTDGQIASFVNTVNTFNVNSLTTEWSLQSVDLSAYQDTQIYIALVHDPDGANVGGLYIDDVQHPSESQDLLFTGLSSSTIGITDAQKNVILNRFIATAASSFTIDSIEFSEVAGGNLQFIDSLRLYNGTAVIARSGYPNLSLNFDISSYSINSGDTLILNADFRSVFSLSYDYQFNVSSLSKIYISGGETITNANFPLTGNLLQNTVIVTANAANPASQPNLNAGVRAWLGSFTLSNSDGLNNTLNSITIQNRVNIGSVSASDIDSVLIYATSALTPTLSSSPTASALFTDDGFGGTGTVTLNPSTSMSGINYHIVYKLSSSRSASNSFGVKVTSISLDSSMSIINLPLSFLTDYTLPVKINHFSAIPGKNWIDLKIITASEPDLSVLEIERHELNTNKFEQIALIELKGNVSSGAEYIHRDNITEPGKRYRYTIYELFLDGSRVKQDLDVEAEVEIPSQFRLGNAYPNPFNPSTRIDFSLPEKSRISIQIYNLLGQLVKEYQQIDLNAGNHYQVWDGRNNVGSNVATGIYYLKFGWTGLDSGQHRSNVLKLVYLK